MSALSGNALLFLVNHVALPPKLPSSEDGNATLERSLLETVVHALQELQGTMHTSEPVLAQKFEAPIATIKNLGLARNSEGYIDEGQLVSLLRNLATNDTSVVVPIEVKAQNAGILASRRNNDIVFEIFELLPQDESVMSIKGRLDRSFPTSAYQISLPDFVEKGFIETLVQTIANVAQQQIMESRRDAGHSLDTTHPILVTEYIASVLSAIGGPTTVTGISKKIRQEVVCSPGVTPWRRSSLWLLVRVTLQLVFSRSTDPSKLGVGLYKATISRILAEILLQTSKEKLDSEVLHVISAKLTRRLRKLKSLPDDIYQVCVNPIRSLLAETHGKMQKAWDDALERTESNIDMAVLSTLRPERDIMFNLTQLDRFLERISSRRQRTEKSNFTPGSQLYDFDYVGLLFESHSYGEFEHFDLFVIEAWVKDNLESWLDRQMNHAKTCERLRQLIFKYFEKAYELYSQSDTPASMSIMYLTIAELWIACDICACHTYPLLKEYDPEVDFSPLQHMSLPFESQLERLSKIERYIQERKDRSNRSLPSLFHEFGHISSFAVRFHDSSASHRKLLSRIKRDAEATRKQKQQEFKEKKEQYETLMAESDALECGEHETIYYGPRKRRRREDTSKCAKCTKRGHAEAIKIEIHEWPLSKNVSEAKATVFELQVPKRYSHWRDTTLYLMMNILGYERDCDTTKTAKYLLFQYAGLSSYCTVVADQRIGIYSPTNPSFGKSVTMKSGVHLLEEDDVCIDNELKYRYFENAGQRYALEKLRSTSRVQQTCTYQLSRGSKKLKRYLIPSSSAYEQLPNSVTASLADCPQRFSVEEYKSFGTLPMGYNIVYPNILVQLAMPVLDFAKVETQTLILQTIHHAGPQADNGAVERVAHDILTNEHFCRNMMREIGDTLQRCKANWETWRALSSCVMLILRILDMNDTPEIQLLCVNSLSSARQICVDWVRVLAERLRRAGDSAQQVELSSSRTEVALVCISTFDVDERHLDSNLQSPGAVSTLLHMSMIVQETKDAISSENRFLSRAAIQSWRLLLFRISPKLRDGLRTGRFQKAFDEAMTAAWAEFRASNTWKVLPAPKHIWAHVTCGQLSVYLNLLTAELLVQGKPLARLPTEYAEHEVYMSLFDGISMEVMPTDEPGMIFSSKHAYFDHTVSLGMDRTDLLVIATKDNQKVELIPSRLFENLLPTAFANRYFHWYNYKKDEIEFRVQHRPWTSDPGSWILKRSGTAWMLAKEQSLLVNPTSRTGISLSKIMSPLEAQKFIHITWDRTNSGVTVDLSRLQMEFDMVRGGSYIKSRQYPSMILDSDQRIGTLVGLTSKLVLRHEREAEDRLLLIPQGSVKYSKSVDRVEVSIQQDTIVKIHAYQLDKTLCRLVDNGSLQSKLLLCHLHGLTSHCLPDRATGHTGTESALTILRSAAVSSFDNLSADNVDVLEQIAQLTPARKYMPISVNSMQQVQWDDQLPFLSQHPAFYVEAKRILSDTKHKGILYGKKTNSQYALPSVHPDLLDRDTIHTSIFRVDGFGAECYTRQFDVPYPGRDRTLGSERSVRSFIATTLILRDDIALHSTIQAEQFSSSILSHYFKDRKVLGPGSPLDSLGFHAKWLGGCSDFLPRLWCTLNSSLSALPKFDVMIWLSTMAFAKNADMSIIQALVAFYKVPGLKTISAPSVPEFDLSYGWRPTMDVIQSLVQVHEKKFAHSPEYLLPRGQGETWEAWGTRKRARFRTSRNQTITAFSNSIHAQWPCEWPSRPVTQNADTYINVSSAMEAIRFRFRFWHRNLRFSQYVKNLSTALADVQVIPVPQMRVQPLTLPQQSANRDSNWLFTAEQLFNLKAPLSTQTLRRQNVISWPAEPKLNMAWAITSIFDNRTQEMDSLALLCDSLDDIVNSSYEEKYVSDLRDSRSSLKSTKEEVQILADGDIEKILRQYLLECQQYFQNVNCILEQVATSGEDIGPLIQHCPRFSPTFWLAQLNKDRFHKLSDGWKKAMIKYGLTVTALHRARRLLSLSKRPIELAEELRHVGHENWDPKEFPETLLLEAESGILVRQVQEEIAQQMRSPPSNQNSVMVLNMGEGKSSVIVPMVAAALADRERLVRVIVAKPQAKQMYQLLVAKLGGLLNRRIYQMPFARSLKLSPAEANIIGDIYTDCMRHRGILLVQPEHILSFQLMAIECQIAEKHDLARSLLRTQEFFNSKSRDIVDESDENYSVKFELVYTMGAQTPIEMSPERWIITQNILDLVARYAPEIKTKFPSSIEVSLHGEHRYPRVRLLREDAEKELLDVIAAHICHVGFPFLPIARQSANLRAAIFEYIRNPNVPVEQVKEVEESEFHSDSTKMPLLLTRGLLAAGILRFALTNKRWRVNYGIDAHRHPKTNLAVPYRSKDSPSPRSEFSHPDVLIVLTSLTYYYGGLTNDDLFKAFAHLQRSDQAKAEYDNWVHTAGPLPDTFRHLGGVNVKDRYQCIHELFPSLRYSKAAIDFFLAHVVFPKEMKQFPHKLSASGWDLGQVKPNPTTGFSGTSDSRFLLPLSVHHLDLSRQKHTNALVLKHLLQPENTVAFLPQRTDVDAAMSDAEYLLTVVNSMSPPTRVILDVGAQILELNNTQVARKWLDMSPQAVKGVVFFNDDEELSALDRYGRVEALQTSPLAKQLDKCLIYLDEAHTRGTDLRLPKDYRAAVTLGANLTKDRLVQACMRMRQLGKGQSVVFCISQEIVTKILECTSKTAATDIEVADVLIWAIAETWKDLSRNMPLWATQGRRFEDHKHLLQGVNTTRDQALSFLEDEAQSIEQRYQPQQRQKTLDEQGWDRTNGNIAKILKRCQDFGTLSFSSATLSEEQERELATEIEEERQVQRPAAMDPAKHELHPDLWKLVKHGTLNKNPQAFIPAFEALSSTSAANIFDVAQFPKDVMVTADFARTVKHKSGSFSLSFVSDSYHRPVQWVLSVYKRATRSQKDPPVQHLVILSPYEANHLFKEIAKSSTVTLHLYAPRYSVVYRSLDTLNLFSVGRPFDPSLVSRSLIAQLNLFAGQLYFNSYEEYVEMCGYLGLAHAPTADGRSVQADGFVMPPISKWGLKKSPVRFLKEMIVRVRREGEGMDKTQLGKMLEGVVLEENDFQ